MPSLNELASYENPSWMERTWHTHEEYDYGMILRVRQKDHDFRPKGSTETITICNDADVYDS